MVCGRVRSSGPCFDLPQAWFVKAALLFLLEFWVKLIDVTLLYQLPLKTKVLLLRQLPYRLHGLAASSLPDWQGKEILCDSKSELPRLWLQRGFLGLWQVCTCQPGSRVFVQPCRCWMFYQLLWKACTRRSRLTAVPVVGSEQSQSCACLWLCSEHFLLLPN